MSKAASDSVRVTPQQAHQIIRRKWRVKPRDIPPYTGWLMGSRNDLWATCADMLGQAMPGNAAEDSHSLLALFRGNKLKKPRAGVVHHSANGTFAIRRGKWKLILGSGSGGRGVPRSKPFDGKVQLYDMEADLSETRNVADAKPEVVKDLTALLESYRKSGRSR